MSYDNQIRGDRRFKSGPVHDLWQDNKQEKLDCWLLLSRKMKNPNSKVAQEFRSKLDDLTEDQLDEIAERIGVHTSQDIEPKDQKISTILLWGTESELRTIINEYVGDTLGSSN